MNLFLTKTLCADAPHDPSDPIAISGGTPSRLDWLAPLFATAVTATLALGLGHALSLAV